MKDFKGTEVNVGDVVAFVEPRYRNLLRGSISKITEHKVRIQYFDLDRRGEFVLKEVLREPAYITKIEP